MHSFLDTATAKR